MSSVRFSCRSLIYCSALASADVFMFIYWARSWRYSSISIIFYIRARDTSSMDGQIDAYWFSVSLEFSSLSNSF